MNQLTHLVLCHNLDPCVISNYISGSGRLATENVMHKGVLDCDEVGTAAVIRLFSAAECHTPKSIQLARLVLVDFNFHTPCKLDVLEWFMNLCNGN
jgi:hypothetical protein